MDSIIFLLAISLFFAIVYGFACNFYYKYNKKLYMRYKSNVVDVEEESTGAMVGEGFAVAGVDDSNKSKEKITCADKPCKHGGKCISGKNIVDGVKMLYKCNCVPQSGVDKTTGESYSNRTFSGYNCEIQDDLSKGVGVKLLDNIDKLVPQIIFEKKPMFKLGKNQWNNYL